MTQYAGSQDPEPIWIIPLVYVSPVRRLENTLLRDLDSDPRASSCGPHGHSSALFFASALPA